MRPSSAIADLLGAPLLDSPWVRRLARVSFLGTLDFHPRSVRPASRLDHSLGVAGLGLDVGRALGLGPVELRHFVAACLLHDIGHFPLSHAAEPGFERALGVAHHGVSEWIVRGNGAIPEPLSLRPVLQAAGLDPDLVWRIIGGHPGDRHELSALLLAPINLDTLDGIVRTARAFHRRHALKLPDAIFVRRDGDLLLVADAIPALDRFWRLKDKIYDDVINLPSNIVCEAALSRAVEAAFDRDVFDRFAEFDDAAVAALARPIARDSGLVGGHDERFQTTRFPPPPAPDEPPPVPRVRKRYHVDSAVQPGPGGLPRRDWSRRYRHSRQLSFVSPRHAAAQLALPGLLEDHDLSDMSDWTLPPGAEGPEI